MRHNGVIWKSSDMKMCRWKFPVKKCSVEIFVWFWKISFSAPLYRFNFVYARLERIFILLSRNVEVNGHIMRRSGVIWQSNDTTENYRLTSNVRMEWRELMTSDSKRRSHYIVTSLFWKSPVLKRFYMNCVHEKWYCGPSIYWIFKMFILNQTLVYWETLCENSESRWFTVQEEFVWTRKHSLKRTLILLI